MLIGYPLVISNNLLINWGVCNVAGQSSKQWNIPLSYDTFYIVADSVRITGNATINMAAYIFGVDNTKLLIDNSGSTPSANVTLILLGY